MSSITKKKHSNIKHISVSRFYILSAAAAMFFFLFADINFVSAKNFTIFNALNVNQPYFSVNGTTGNVGIGTTDPGAQLEVGTNLPFTGKRIRILGYSTSGSSDANLEIGDGGGVYWRFLRNSSNAFEMNLSSTLGIMGGNVGIGTTAPDATLDIGGAVASFRAKSGTLSNIGSGIIMADGSGNLYSTSSLAAISAGWTVNGTTVYKTDINGNVGIGTTGPGAKLHIQNTAGLTTLGSSAALLLGGKGGGSAVGERLELGLKSWNSFGSSHGGMGIITTSVASNETADLYFYTLTTVADTAPTEKMRITSTGSVGIGTTAPGANAKLAVIGNVTIGDAPQTADAALHITLSNQRAIQMSQTGSSKNSFLLQASQSAGGAAQWWTYGINMDNTFRINPGADTIGGSAFVINSSGNVGIGKTNPLAKLDVNGAISGLSFTAALALGGSGNHILFTDDGGTINRSSLLTNTNDTELGINGGIVYKRTPIDDAPYTALPSDYIIAYTSLSTDRILYLPTCNSAAAGRAYIIVNETGGESGVVVTPVGGGNIDGAASFRLQAYWSTPVYCNGNNSWFIY